MRHKKGFGEIIFDILLVFVMVFVTIVCFYPFLYMLMLSFSSGDVYGKALLVPVGFSTAAYQMIATELDFFSNIWVSVLRSVVGPVSYTHLGNIMIPKCSSIPNCEMLRVWIIPAYLVLNL